VLLAEATSELLALAELAGIPVATTLMGKGAMPEGHPLALGTGGIWGTRVAVEYLHEADVVLAIGTGFSESDCSSWDPKVSFQIPPARLIQIDIDSQEIGKIYPGTVGIVADAKAALAALLEEVTKQPPSAAATADRRHDSAARKAAWEQELAGVRSDSGRPIHPARLLAEIGKALPEDAVVVTDVGWNKNGAGQQLPVQRPRSYITSGGFATMGFAPAAAIGAKLGAPDRKV